MKKWLLPKEVAILTVGLKEITFENLNKILKFSGGNSVIINFFKRYLEESEPEILSGFVKFTTGYIKIYIFIKFIFFMNVKKNYIGSSKLPFETK